MSSRPDPAPACTGTRLGSVLYRTPDQGRDSITGTDGRTITTLPASFTADESVSPVTAGDHVILPGQGTGDMIGEASITVVNIRTSAIALHPVGTIRALTSDAHRAHTAIGNVGNSL